jgi:ABC-2 type transport system permease protein
MTLSLLRLETVRMLRDPKYLALAVAAPIGFYLLFATLFGGGHTRPGELPGTVEIMVAMAAYGAIWAVLSTTGPRIAEERQTEWLQQLRSMPISGVTVLGSKVVASVLTALPAIVLVCVTAAVAKGVSMTVGQWVALVAALWLGSTTFAALGIAIGFLVGSDAAYPLSYGLYMAMSALGGLWVPPAILPSGLRDVALWMPTYRLGNLGWEIAGGTVPDLTSVAILIAWTAGLAAVAFLAYRRPRFLWLRPSRTTLAHPAVDAEPVEATAVEAPALREPALDKLTQ